MYQVLYDVALRIGLGLILAAVLLVFITILQTIFYNYNKEIRLLVIAVILALIIYALGDIALDILRI